MKYLNNTLAFLFALALLAGAAYGVYRGFGYIQMEAQSVSLQEPWQVILLTLSVSAFVCVLIIASAIRKACKADPGIPYEKRNAYLSFIQNWQQADNVVLSQVLAIYASNNVLNEYLRLRKLLQSLSAKDEKVLLQVEKVITEMRKDLGYGNNGIVNGALVRLTLPVQEYKKQADEVLV